MGKSCVVCGKKYLPRISVSFHKIPINAALRQKWIDNLKLSLEVRETVPLSSYVCSDHFKPCNFYEGAKVRKLKNDAIPELYISPRETVQIEKGATSSRANNVNFIKIQPKIESSPSTLSTETCSENGWEKRANNVNFTIIQPKIEPSPSPSTLSTETCSENGSPYANRGKFVEDNFDSGNVRKKNSRNSSTSSTETGSEVGSPDYRWANETFTGSSSSTETTSDVHVSDIQKRKFRYSGDVRRQDLKTAVVKRKAWHVLQTTISNQKKKIRMLQQKTRRLEKKIVSLKSPTKYLKDKAFISDNAETIIKAATPDLPEEFFQHFLAGSSKQKYGPKLREFALTLHFLSPQAYNFVRETFNYSLPHPKSLQKWFQSVDGEPGSPQNL